MINRRNPFWREVYRDTLRGLVAHEGPSGLIQAPRFAQLCAAAADEAVKQERLGTDPCVICNGRTRVLRSDVEETCSHCDGQGIEPLPDDTIAPPALPPPVDDVAAVGSGG